MCLHVLTCRRYTECINFLYSHNTFVFDDLELIPMFLNSVLYQRSRCITSFYLTPTLNEPPIAGGFARRYEPLPTQSVHLVPTINRIAHQPSLRYLNVTHSSCAAPQQLALILRMISSMQCKSFKKSTRYFPTLVSHSTGPTVRR